MLNRVFVDSSRSITEIVCEPADSELGSLLRKYHLARRDKRGRQPARNGYIVAFYDGETIIGTHARKHYGQAVGYARGVLRMLGLEWVEHETIEDYDQKIAVEKRYSKRKGQASIPKAETVFIG